MKLLQATKTHRHAGIASTFLIAFLSAPALHADTINSALGGDYTAVATWVGPSVPGEGDTANVNHSSVIVAASVATDVHIINSGGRLRVDDSLTLEDITLNTGGEIRSHNGNDTITIATLTINGGAFKDRNGRNNNGIAATTISGAGDLSWFNESNTTNLAIALFIDCPDTTGYSGTIVIDGDGPVDLTQDILPGDSSFAMTIVNKPDNKFVLSGDVAVTSLTVNGDLLGPETYTLDTVTNMGAVDLSNVGGTDYSAFFGDLNGTITVTSAIPQDPSFSSDPLVKISALEGSDYSFDGESIGADAADPQGQPMTFSKEAGPAWLTVDTTTGDLGGTPGPSDAGMTNLFTVRATDTDTNIGETTLDIYVEGVTVNNPPMFDVDPFSKAIAIVGQPYTGETLDGSAFDLDSDPLDYTKMSGPAWLMIDTSTGNLSGTPGGGDSGINSFMVQADDLNGGTDTATLNINVIINNPPVFSMDPITVHNGTVNLSFESFIDGFASDVDGDTLTYHIDSGPGWLNITSAGSNRGRINGTPLLADLGLNSFDVRIEDGKGGSVTATLEITVENNAAPVFLSDPVVKGPIHVGVPLGGTLMVDASDPNVGDMLGFAGAPSWVSAATDGSLSGTPAGGDIGTSSTTVTVSDFEALSDTAALQIEVLAAPAGSIFFSQGGDFADSTSWNTDSGGAGSMGLPGAGDIAVIDGDLQEVNANILFEADFVYLNSGSIRWQSPTTLTVNDFVHNGGDINLFQNTADIDITGTYTINGGRVTNRSNKKNFTVKAATMVGSGLLGMDNKNGSATFGDDYKIDCPDMTGYSGTIFTTSNNIGGFDLVQDIDSTNASFGLEITDGTGWFWLSGDVAVTSLTVAGDALPDGTYTLDTGTNPGATDLTNVGGTDYSAAFRDQAGTITVDMGAPPADDFSTWIAMFSVGGEDGFADDPNKNGVANGIESVIGADPSATGGGSPVNVVSQVGSVFTFQHNLNKSVAIDVTWVYEWSTDGKTWNANGAPNGGTTVTFGSPSVIDGSDPVFEVVQNTATSSGIISDVLIVRIKATN